MDHCCHGITFTSLWSQRLRLPSQGIKLSFIKAICGPSHKAKLDITDASKVRLTRKSWVIRPENPSLTSKPDRPPKSCWCWPKTRLISLDLGLPVKAIGGLEAVISLVSISVKKITEITLKIKITFGKNCNFWWFSDSWWIFFVVVRSPNVAVVFSKSFHCLFVIFEMWYLKTTKRLWKNYDMSENYHKNHQKLFFPRKY